MPVLIYHSITVGALKARFSINIVLRIVISLDQLAEVNTSKYIHLEMS